MTDWRAIVTKPASFRGVPFFVDTSELGGGRRTVKHEFPLRDAPFIEDLGRKAREFPVEGHVVGADYLVKRDALIAALEKAGPGELVHPYYGTRRVACSAFRVRESSDAGGMASFSVTFEETEASPAFPDATPAAAATLATSADAAAAAAGAYFTERYGVAKQPIQALASLKVALAAAASTVASELAPLVQTADALATMRRDLGELASGAEDLVGQPGALLSALLGALGALAELPLDAERGARAMLAASAFAPGSERPPDTTPTRQRERENFDALLHLVRVVLVVQAARLAAIANYESYEAAVAVRDAVAAKLDEQMDLASDEAYATLEQLRADLGQAVPGPGSDLPHLASYTPESVVPSLVLAHRLYGELSREADLVTRNRLLRPGFIPGGAKLEVLVDG